MQKLLLVVLVGLIVIGFFSYSLIQDVNVPSSPSQNPMESSSEDSVDSSESPDKNSPRNVPSEGSSGASSTYSGDPLLEPHYCSSSSRDLECGEEQDVVCGWFSEQGSCNGPCVKLYVNTCQACIDSRVEYWTYGDCPIHG